MTRPIGFLNDLIHRLSGQPRRPADGEATEVFRDFASRLERQLSSEADDGPRVRLPVSAPLAGRMRP